MCDPVFDEWWVYLQLFLVIDIEIFNYHNSWFIQLSYNEFFVLAQLSCWLNVFAFADTDKQRPSQAKEKNGILGSFISCRDAKKAACAPSLYYVPPNQQMITSVAGSLQKRILPTCSLCFRGTGQAYGFVGWAKLMPSWLSRVYA